MNPNYNQPPQPYYNYQQHTPGPPQPSWQNQTPQSPAGWNDHRFQTFSPPPPLPPPPPHPPQSPQYGQNTWVPPSGHHSQYPPPPPHLPAGAPGPAQHLPVHPQDGFHRPITPQYDTTQWGVNYNQGQHQQYHPDPQHGLQPEQKPVLPPRPISSLSHVSQHQQQASLSNYHQTTNQYPPKGSWNIPHTQDPEPPTPPPRPTGYAASVHSDLSGVSQDQYSHHPSTYQYDPHNQAQPGWQHSQQYQTGGTSQSAWGHTHHMSEGPVSPIEDERRRQSLVSRPPLPFVDAEPPSQNMQMPDLSMSTSTPTSVSITHIDPQPSSTAFGPFGGPTDWQHYDPTDPHGSTEEAITPTVSRKEQHTAPLIQSKLSLKRKSIERIRPSPNQQYSSPKVQSFTPVTKADTIELSQATASPQKPAALQHRDTEQSDVSSISGIERNDTIDNVIQAWYAPLTVDSAVQTSLPPTRKVSLRETKDIPPKIETLDQGVQTDFKPQVETRIETRVETKEVEIDPYADIQNQYRATLKRFADMLRQESTAEKDEDKFKIFQGFVIHELRLRSVLYGVESFTQEAAPKVGYRDEGSQQLASTPPKHPQNASTSVEFGRVEDKARNIDQPTPPRIDTRTLTSPSTKDESFVVVNRDGEEDEYSPGGRPRIAPLKMKSSASIVETPNSGRSQPILPSTTTQEPTASSPSTNAPMTLDDYVMPDQPPSPSNNAPIVVDSDIALAGPVNTQLTGPINFQPARPLYQPFRYGERGGVQVPEVYVHSPPPESFAALRQSNATESGRTLVHDAPPTDVESMPNRNHSKTPSSGRREHEEAFIGLIRAKSQALRKTNNTTPRPDSPAILRAGTPANRSTPSPAPTPVSPLVKSVQSFCAFMPKVLPPYPGPKTAPHPKLEPMITSMHKFVDDFSFIHTRVLTWDKSNRQIRAKLDAERQVRQSQNEEHIDQLFNDNEIGYADIGELEKDFKLEEAGKKYQEDQEEFESFTKGVFDFVAERLDSEIRELTRMQTNAGDMLDLESTTAAKQIQSLNAQSTSGATPGVASVCAIMQVLLELYEKLEVRYLKIAEAKFERERRRKRLELSVLYTNNDKPGIKKLEAEFAKAEKLQILEESRRKAERANRLLDVFDRAVVRGLAENQGMVDDILTRLQLMRDLIMGSEENGPQGPARENLLYGPDGVKELMDRTSAMIDFIHNDSKDLVQMLDKSDTLSNNADFELYTAEAKLADASSEKFQKLKSEKESEDKNVHEELTNRLSGVARVPGEISVLIREVRDKIGTDAGHEERIGKALEAARRRNTGLSG